MGLVLGTFVASGAMHNVPFYACGPTVDPVTGVVLSRTGMPGLAPIWFFLAQSIGLAIERGYKAVTGRNVNGWVGRVWVWLCEKMNVGR